MPTVLTHSIVGLTLGKSIKWKQSSEITFYSFICGSLPDLDFIGRYFGVQYIDHWGHRGWTHSLVSATLIGLVLSLLCGRKTFLSKLGWWIYFSFLTSTHTLLDMCTNGGHGVALLAPWSHSRLFFPQKYRVVQVSPMHFQSFTWEKLVPVFMSELTWIVAPILIIFTIRLLYEIKKCKVS